MEGFFLMEKSAPGLASVLLINLLALLPAPLACPGQGWPFSPLYCLRGECHILCSAGVLVTLPSCQVPSLGDSSREQGPVLYLSSLGGPALHSTGLIQGSDGCWDE